MRLEDKKRLLFDIASKDIDEKSREGIMYILSEEYSFEKLLNILDDND